MKIIFRRAQLAIVVALSVVISATDSMAAADPARQMQKLEAEIEKLEAKLSERRESLLDLQGADSSQLALQREADSLAAVQAVEDALKEALEASVPTPVVERVDHLDRDLNFDFDGVRMDSLVSLWREDKALAQYDMLFTQYIDVEAMGGNATSAEIDSIYKQRLLSLASPVELPYHSIIRDYITRYTSPKSSLMSNVLSRSQYFFPLIEDELIKHNLPIELRSMAIIESALSNTAVSPAGAAGLWQFMPSTGKAYKLEINSLVDERYDPVKSTVAACQFMTDLYNMFDDWTLAIAAYNCGPGNVNKAITRSGAKNGTFWDVYYYLPSETRGYVPAFIASSYAVAYHKQHNIVAKESVLPLATDTLVISRIMHLGQVAETLNLPIELLRSLNPQYRRDIIPATTKSYILRLPQEYVCKFIEQEDAINAKDAQYLKEYINPINIEKLRSVAYNTLHIVKSGETLSGIASKYRISVTKLKADNNIKDAHKIRIGQKLKIIK